VQCAIDGQLAICGLREYCFDPLVIWREVGMTESHASRDEPANPPKAPTSHSRLRNFSSATAIAIFLIAGVILIGGWLLDIENLRTLSLRSAAMVPNTALGLMGSAAALWLLIEGAGKGRRFIGRVCACLPVAFGAFTLGEYVVGHSFGIDDLLVPHLSTSAAALVALRPWVATSIALLLVGFSLLTLDRPYRKGWRISDACALGAGLLAVAGSLGYIIEGSGAASAGFFVTMALPTTLSVLLLASALLTARPRAGLMADVLNMREGAAAQPRLWIVGLIAAFALVGYSASLAWLHAASARAASEWMIRSFGVEVGLADLLSSLKDIEVGSRGYVIAGDTAFLEPFENAVRSVTEIRDHLSELITDGDQQARLAALNPLITERIAISRDIVDMRRNLGFEVAREAVVEISGKKVMDKIRVAVADLQARQHQLLNQRVAAAQREALVVPVLIVTSAAAGSGTLLSVFLLVLRENRFRRKAESRLDRFFEGSLDLLCITGADGYFRRLNPAFSELLGYSRDELMARPFMDFIHPEDHLSTLAQIERLGKGSPMLSFENRFLCKDGSYRWLAWKSQPDLPEGVRYATARDMTEHKLTEAALHRSRAHLQSLFESLPGLYLVLTPSLTIVAASDAYLAATMLKREAVVDRGLFEVFPDNPDDPAASGTANLRASLERVRETRAPDMMAIQKYDIRRPDGSFEERFWSPVNSPLLGPERQLEYFIHRVEDVTEFMRHQARPAGDAAELRVRLQGMEAEIFQSATRLQQAKRQLEAANKDLESFTYSVSHDLRAPLRHIQGYVELLTREIGTAGLSARAQQHLKTLSDVSAEMGQLIDDLLAFSRMGQVVLRADRVRLDVLVKDALRGLEMAMKDRIIDWKIAPLPDVQGDFSALKHVFSNLLGNAIKYTRTRERASIEIGCAGVEDGSVILFVRDNGVGFDMQYAHKLFGVFQRLHRAEEFEGTGIGLAIVRQVVSRHEGRVWAEAKLNEGTAIYFTLHKMEDQTDTGDTTDAIAKTHPVG
jgi:PAS domain S-box-containing protein